MAGWLVSGFHSGRKTQNAVQRKFVLMLTSEFFFFLHSARALHEEHVLSSKRKFVCGDVELHLVKGADFANCQLVFLLGDRVRARLFFF